MGTINVDNIKSADGGNTVKVGTATFQGNNLHLTGSTVARVQFSSSGTGNVSVDNNTAFIEGNDDTIVINAAANGNTIFQENNTERMRMDTSGRLLVGATTYDSSNKGVLLNGATGLLFATADGDAPFKINRLSSDGELVELSQAGSKEGNISVSGSTVSYNGFSGLHESSGIATNTPIGTVVSTIDELDIYSAKQNGMDGEEEDSPKAGQIRADHAKVKVSDTAGDKAVYGVVGSFNAQGKVNVASVGIGSVRVTGACAKGDLLESNGDGTAKVQSDDIIRSKTLGKVTIGNSDTKEKLVSCVLYCG